VIGGRRRLSGWSFDDAKTTVAYVASSMTKPTELYIASVDGQGERQLTRFNDKLNSEIAWSDAERFTYKSVGGLEIEGWLMKRTLEIASGTFVAGSNVTIGAGPRSIAAGWEGVVEEEHATLRYEFQSEHDTTWSALSWDGERFELPVPEGIPEGEPISYFRNGDFIDLCAGPHVMRTGNIGAFKLTHVASAYYKGDERNPQLQRIYGTAFKNKTEMEAYFTMLEEAKKRDHRKIGAEMGLYALDSEYVGPGMPLWLPKGTVIVEELEKLAKETEFAAGYVRVRTPHLAKEKMYKTSGHLPYYAESMFPAMELKEKGAENEEPERYYLKAMTCPHHHRIFAAEPRSYRDLPLRNHDLTWA
jgi:hypothetical protein